jgi:phage host-nuclease inhibitor protein Gam
MDELANVLAGEPAEKKPFEVVDYSGANWAVTTAMDATAMMGVKQAIAEAWHKRIDDWLVKQCAEYESTKRAMEELLKPFIERELAGKKTRSIALPGGKAGFRKAPDALEIKDEAAALSWARDHVPDAVKVKVTESVLKEPLEKHIEATGEIPDGVELIAGKETFYIKPLE